MKHKSQSTLILTTILSLLTLVPQQAIFAQTSPKSEKRLERTEELERQIYDTVRQISVRILYGESTGSGVIIKREDIQKGDKIEYRYLVLTNQHVIKEQKEFKVETPDARYYVGKPLTEANKKFQEKNDLDLALVYFSSPIKYGYAEFYPSSNLDALHNKKIYVTGFPCEKDADNECNKVDFAFIPDKAFIFQDPLTEGRQIGYQTDVIEGISGGAIVNKKGQLIGINSIRHNSINSSYDYENGQPVPKEWKYFMKFFSWGIPVHRYKGLFPSHPKIPATQVASSSINSSSPLFEVKVDGKLWELSTFQIIIGLIVLFFLGIFVVMTGNLISWKFKDWISSESKSKSLGELSETKQSKMEDVHHQSSEELSEEKQAELENSHHQQTTKNTNNDT